MNHQHDIDKLKEIKTNIEVLNQKRTQFQGAINTLKEQETELVTKIEKEYQVSPEQLPKQIEEEKAKIQQEEERIISVFTELYNNEKLKGLIKIQPPFTIDAIYEEIQNNLLSIKSQTEGQVSGLEKQQDEIVKTLKEDYSVDVENVEDYISNLDTNLKELEQSIQAMYQDIMNDEELKSLLK